MDAKDLYVEKGKNGLYGVKSFIHPDNEWFIAPTFTDICEFENMLDTNFTIAKKDGKAFLIDQKGEQVSDKYDEIVYHGTFYKMKSNGKWGYMNAKGKVEIIPQYDEAGSMDDDRAIVTIDDNKFLIDKSGKKLSGPYQSIRPKWRDDNSWIFIVESTDGLKGIIDKDGKEISNFSCI